MVVDLLLLNGCTTVPIVVIDMVRIRKNRPLVSGNAPVSRETRRRSLDRPYQAVELPESIRALCLGLLAATTTMTGCTIGTFLRLAGL